MNTKVREVITSLEGKGGEAYDAQGDTPRHGWRNPVKADTPDLLVALVLAARPHRILELGTAYGFSGLHLASTGAPLDTIEFFAPVAEEASRNFRAAGVNAHVYTGDALDIIPVLPNYYDFVFLDAEKKSYLQHLLALINHGKLVPGALIVADNVIDRAEEMEDFLSYIKPYVQCVIKTQAGLLVARV